MFYFKLNKLYALYALSVSKHATSTFCPTLVSVLDVEFHLFFVFFKEITTTLFKLPGFILKSGFSFGRKTFRIFENFVF